MKPIAYVHWDNNGKPETNRFYDIERLTMFRELLEQKEVMFTICFTSLDVPVQ